MTDDEGNNGARGDPPADADELRVRHAELTAFVRRLAHDMGAPLRTIQGFAEVLMLTAGPQLDGKAREQLERLGAAATRLDGMVKALGRYARVGPTEPPAEPTDLTALAQDTWQLLAADVERLGAQLDVEEMPCVPVAEAPLRSVFLNLFDNALRYAGDAAPWVTVSASSHSGEVHVSVLDNGPGIEAEQIEWALAPGSAGEGGGAGMGLAIARAHIEAHGGRLGIESNPQRGTRVWFTLPRSR